MKSRINIKCGYCTPSREGSGDRRSDRFQYRQGFGHSTQSVARRVLIDAAGAAHETYSLPIVVIGLGAVLYQVAPRSSFLIASGYPIGFVERGWPRGMALAFMGTRQLMGNGTTCTN